MPFSASQPAPPHGPAPAPVRAACTPPGCACPRVLPGRRDLPGRGSDPVRATRMRPRPRRPHRRRRATRQHVRRGSLRQVSSESSWERFARYSSGTSPRYAVRQLSTWTLAIAAASVGSAARIVITAGTSHTGCRLGTTPVPFRGPTCLIPLALFGYHLGQTRGGVPRCPPAPRPFSARRRRACQGADGAATR